MFARRRNITIETDRLTLRLPKSSDHLAWAQQRQASADFLKPWEPVWSKDHLSRKAFSNRVLAAVRSVDSGLGLPLFLIRREDNLLLGALTLDNIQRGPSQSGTIGYWIAQEFARQGYMREAVTAVVHHAFTQLDLSRIQAGCLPENKASRGVLEKTGFKYEGVAQSYLQIGGRWRTHVLYANLRHDRRGRTGAG
ncbi:MAG: GNAT family N-acetyltransferase [Rhodobacteraceae bacterium]|nr:GNAT family N-acetyltransferase [Paracoccaceae bacterium]